MAHVLLPELQNVVPDELEVGLVCLDGVPQVVLIDRLLVVP